MLSFSRVLFQQLYSPRTHSPMAALICLDNKLIIGMNLKFLKVFWGPSLLYALNAMGDKLQLKSTGMDDKKNTKNTISIFLSIFLLS